MRVKLIYIVCLIAVVLIGCAKPPLTEMENAREAVFRAENDANAAVYAAGALARARDALKRMEMEFESKRYDAARTNAAEAIAAAEKAINDGRLGAERAKSDSASVLSRLGTEIDETGRNIDGARQSGLPLNYRELNGDLDKAKNGAAEAQADQADGRYNDALNKARGARSELAGINERIAGAAPRKK